MISRDPPCIGIANRDVYKAHAKQRSGDVEYDLIKTVCITRGEGPAGTTHVLYEVEKVVGSFDRPRYRVFGVWVPLLWMPQDRIHAVAETGVTDGYIV